MYLLSGFAEGIDDSQWLHWDAPRGRDRALPIRDGPAPDEGEVDPTLKIGAMVDIQLLTRSVAAVGTNRSDAVCCSEAD